MKKLLILALTLASLNAAEQIKISALTRTTALTTNSIIPISIISGSSSNTYHVPLEILIHAGITNSSTLNWARTEGKLVGWATNLTSAEIGDTINFAVITLNADAYDAGWSGSTNAATQGDIYAKIESLSLGGSSVFVNAASVSAPNFKSGTNILFVVGDTTNVFGIPTNIVGNMLVNNTITGTQVDESTLGEVPTAATAGAGDSATGFFSVGTVEAARLPNLSGLNGQIADTQIVDGAVDGGAGGEIADNTLTTDDLAANSVGNSEASDTLAFDILTVTYDAYAAGWATSTNVPTKRAVYDKIESILVSGGDGTANWTGVGTTNSSLAGQFTSHSAVITNDLTLGDGLTALLETWPLGGIRTNAGNNVGITNNLFHIWNSNGTFNADLFVGTTNVAGELTAKANKATTVTVAGTSLGITSSAGAQDLSANRTWTLSLDRTATLGGNPAFSGGFAGFATTGIIFEGATADTIEGLLTTADPTASDKTWTLPNANTFIPIISQVLTISGMTAARTMTVPDANFTVARTDAGQTFSGDQIFGGTTTFPNGAAPTTGTTTGRLALDTTIIDHQGLFQYYSGASEMLIIAIKRSDLSSVDNHILKYDAATDSYVPDTDETGAGGADADAIHDNVAGEIVLITEKTAVVANDEIIIEDSEDSNNKKSVKVTNLPVSAPTTTALNLKAPLASPVFTGNITVGSTAGSATLTAGQVNLNTTSKQLGIHNGTKEVAIPLTRRFPFTFDPKAICDGTFDGLFLFTVDEPFGITITSWKLSFEADPTTEVDLDLKRADAFIGRANSAVMDVLDTTTGASSEATAANINAGAVVANGKVVYLEFGTAYSEANHQMIFEITYEIEED